MSGGAVGAGVSGVGSLVSGALGASGAASAAKIQARTASAQAAALGQAGQAAQDYLNPYVAAGQNALGGIQSNMSLWGNINNGYTDQAQGVQNTAANNLTNLANNGITQQSIENTPGWSQINALGQQGVANASAARGLANSGAAMKGAADYATTQANQTYQNLYNDQISSNNALLGVGNGLLATNEANQGNINNAFNRENALLGYGASAATNSAQNALTAAGASANYGAQSGNALASGVVGSSNALASGLNGAGNSYLLYQALLNGKNS